MVGQGHVAKVDWGVVEHILGVKVETTNEILRRIANGLPLLCSPLEVRRRVYDLSPLTDFNGEVE